ncbi:hypothetical protein DL98DRAFT_518701 [Cadophora sp. DSE1049]|nr:hypothetical protein DL98DRAFT_518701 [Cadophora sp. DSE1049]
MRVYSVSPHAVGAYKKFPFPCPSAVPQLSSPQKPRPATSSDANAGPTTNELVTPRKIANGLRNTSPLSHQDVPHKTGVDLVTYQVQ